MPSHRPMTIARTFILTLALLLLAIPASRAQDPQPQSRDTFAAAIKKALPSVVGIQVLTLEPVEETSPFFNHPAALNGAEPQKTRTRRSGSSGSGVIAMATKDTGLIITNFHVIQDAERIGVRLTDGRAFEAHLVGRDAATDIAVLSVEAPDLKPITFSPRKPQVGDVVLAIGGPFGLDATATMGIVSNLFRSSIRYRNFEGYIQHDASINPGNSGGALLDVNGDLLGINTAIAGPTGASVGLGFAQLAGLAIKTAHQLVKYGKVRRGQIGIASTDLTQRLAAEHKIPFRQAAMVTSVVPDSPAAKAGIEVGDVIDEAGVPRDDRFLGIGESLSMVPIMSQRALETVLGINAVGDKLMLRFNRGPKTEFVGVQFAPLSNDAPTYPAPESLVRLRGLVVSELGPLNEKFGEVNGVVVTDAKPGSMAQYAGLLPGDIITHVKGHEIRKPEDLFQGADGGEIPEIRLMRGTTPIRFKLPY